MRGSPFFEGVDQTELTLDGQTGKLPLFYYDGVAMTAMFPARLGRLRKLLPDSRFVSARLAPGLGAVAISAFEYRDTGIGPYNELAISVVLKEPPFLPNIPGVALVQALRRRKFHAFVHHLPVTTEIARICGIRLYNYPKFIAAIDFEEDQDVRTCELAEGKEHILTLRGRRIAARRSDQFQVYSHLWMDRQPQRSEFKINASELGMTSAPSAASLELGDQHPIALELKELLLSKRPLHYQYMPRFEGILYGPDHLTLPLLQQVQEAARQSELVKAA